MVVLGRNINWQHDPRVVVVAATGKFFLYVHSFFFSHIVSGCLYGDHLSTRGWLFLSMKFAFTPQTVLCSAALQTGCDLNLMSQPFLF